MCAQQINPLPENTSQNDAIFAQKYVDHLTLLTFLELCNHHTTYIYYGDYATIGT